MKSSPQSVKFTGIPALFRALLIGTIFCSLALITLGGVVHNTDSSLACPDWPLCFGQVFPEMTGGVAIEHSHRLLASLVGILVIGLVVLSRKNRQLRKQSLISLTFVILQGLLGGLTVILKISPLVSTLHLALSQIFIAHLTLIWIDTLPPHNHSIDPESFMKLKNKHKLLCWATGALYFQMLFGASLRHGGAGIACGVGAEASIFCLDYVTGVASFWPTGLAAKVNLFHRAFALVVTGLIIASTLPVLKFAKASEIPKLKLGCIATHALVCLQVAWGVASVWTGLAVVPVTLHLITAAVLWLLMVGILRYTQNAIEGPGPFTIASETSKRV